MRITDAEFGLLKNTFSDNEMLVKAIRKVFFQVKLTEEEAVVFASAVSSKPEVIALLRKLLLPTIDADAPLHQVIDLWLTVNIREKTPDQSYCELLARDVLISYLEQQFGQIEGAKAKKTDISLEKLTNLSEKSPLEAHVNILARNTAINHIEQQLSQILILAGRKEETVEETKERLQKDSTK